MYYRILLQGYSRLSTEIVLNLDVCVERAGDPRGTEAIRGACKDVGSVSNIIFEMRFNPDVFCPGTPPSGMLCHY